MSLIELTPLSIPHVKLTCNPQKKTCAICTKTFTDISTILHPLSVTRPPTTRPLLLLTPHAMTPLFLEHSYSHNFWPCFQYAKMLIKIDPVWGSQWKKAKLGRPGRGRGSGNIAGHIKSAYALCRKVCSCFLLPSNPRVERKLGLQMFFRPGNLCRYSLALPHPSPFSEHPRHPSGKVFLFHLYEFLISAKCGRKLCRNFQTF